MTPAENSNEGRKRVEKNRRVPAPTPLEEWVSRLVLWILVLFLLSGAWFVIYAPLRAMLFGAR